MRARNPAYTQRLLALNVRERRLRKSWTQYDLADETRLRQALISEIEAGKANPTLLSLHKIASALGVQVAELVLPQGTVLAQGTKPVARGRAKPAKKNADAR
ncbi:helix-turn-helix transcriptional regulator [Bradyrhizobium liaoningense]|uniref:helix-turn-helix transcriptional regulator n=1 Tax=Bradyrhizobium liaoningense TaxID=43992 RepID=UPI001BA9E111|nr:helix-turn-helix transcriptional regulator [Bradyrhizobium liaoningense]MBR0838913.1 helix-turn-helix transcriptional regulator [Bradyrhizobium liaoningense]